MIRIPRNTGRDVDDVAKTGLDHFSNCPFSGALIDMRDLGQIMDFAIDEKGNSFSRHGVFEQIPLCLSNDSRSRPILGRSEIHRSRVFLSEVLEGWSSCYLEEVTNSVFDLIRRGLTIILVRDSNVGLPLAIGIENFYFADRYIGPELPFGGITQMTKLPFSGFPKPIGGQPQAYRRDSKDYRESSDNSLVVVVALEDIRPALESQKRPGKEGGAILMFIIVGGLLTVLWLYQARP
jgi:hypothetical protein